MAEEQKCDTFEKGLKEMLKQNQIAAADWHRKGCKSDCGVSLHLMGRLLEAAGIDVTFEEKKKFFM